MSRPLVALILGDPAGIGPELAAKLLASEEVRAATRLLVIGDRRVLESGAAVAGVTLDVEDVADAGARISGGRPALLGGGRIDPASVLRGIRLTDAAMRAAGVAAPRIAVAALNPHAGDGGNFGREEIDVLAPAVERGRREGMEVESPFPSHTVFLRARAGLFDAVLTMYHDQGQIAMKLMGFDRGVTFLGGFAFPICTPAHGTAYEIAGRGVADAGASVAAVLLAAGMAASRLGLVSASSTARLRRGPGHRGTRSRFFRSGSRRLAIP